MNTLHRLKLILAMCCLLLVAADPVPSDFWKASGPQAAVVTGTREATEASLAVLKDGGNAADAAATALLVLCVTDPGNYCFGGEVPILVYDAQHKSTELLAGQGVAPRLATLEHFQKLGGIPGSGPQPAAVPASPDAIITLLDRHGTISFRRATEPMLQALDLRKEPWGKDLAVTVREMVAAEQTAGTDRRLGLRRVADYFYRGPVAQRLDAWSQANGGLIRRVDLATHVTRIEAPLKNDYRGYTVVKCGVWTQGPFLHQTLNLLEGFDIKGLKPHGADYVHLTAEAMKLAFADRDTYYADPLFVDVPLDGLLSKEYASIRRGLIDSKHASLEIRPGQPRTGSPASGASVESLKSAGPQRDTTTCITSDRWGNIIAATPSGWGGVVAGSTGVQLGTRLISLNTIPGHPNCIEPGKRPRITLTPTLVFKGDSPVLAISVAGGDLQDQVTLQLLLNCLEFGLDPAAAVTAPRYSTAHHTGSFRQPPPQLGSLMLDGGFPADVVEDLKQRGHDVKSTGGPIGHPCVLKIDANGFKSAAGDPKARRYAAAY
jgi:gamma-glutamyltranspeptidase/glutathione hydrolase